MSGNPSTSSGGGSTGGSGGAMGSGAGAGGGDACLFEFTTVLGSPDPAQVGALSVGAWLAVTVQDDPPAVTVSRHDGTVVGGITQHAAMLRSCIQQGYGYTAQVQAINGGAVQVHVRPS